MKFVASNYVVGGHGDRGRHCISRAAVGAVEHTVYGNLNSSARKPPLQFTPHHLMLLPALPAILHLNLSNHTTGKALEEMENTFNHDMTRYTGHPEIKF